MGTATRGSGRRRPRRPRSPRPRTSCRGPPRPSPRPPSDTGRVPSPSPPPSGDLPQQPLLRVELVQSDPRRLLPGADRAALPAGAPAAELVDGVRPVGLVVRRVRHHLGGGGVTTSENSWRNTRSNRLGGRTKS